MTNKERAEQIAKTLYGYAGDAMTPPDPADIAYALADIMHWADTFYGARGGVGGFVALCNWAAEHYEEEKANEQAEIVDADIAITE